MKALVGTFNQEKALGGLFSMIVKTGCETDGSFYSTTALLLFLASRNIFRAKNTKLAGTEGRAGARDHGRGV